jgi:hypothetical protein
MNQVFPIEDDLPTHNLARQRNQFHDRCCHDRFPAASFPDNPQYFSFGKSQTDAVNGLEYSSESEEIRVQVFYFKDNLVHLCSQLGVKNVPQTVPDEIESQNTHEDGQPWECRRPPEIEESNPGGGDHQTPLNIRRSSS